mmetsp:Transcript_3194/g.4896  ORF Transcript_3194/g.4896 Transcript_3194/m.4896 type:complete len:335 (-) Transcript_3194:397-1401(-)|eukprot:CAMPEP_0184676520 /NCGR_PEP_ID=MMETSP0308-20130426/88396_1 /TAXON_ID=38269 /ORGANISM="Gloeochaete witrockiana, Strain SAG 46.84" /LENGTH=334 /DNA_ID=CAMNT_0027124361 /DNA_START=90 /DNA_END=1094 /DNA_ORIENTATION=+
MATVVQNGNGTEVHLRRPQNSFMLFSNAFRSRVQGLHTHLNNQQVSRLLGIMWRDLPAEKKKPYEDSAKRIKEQFDHEHPGVKFKRRKKPKKLCGPVSGSGTIIEEQGDQSHQDSGSRRPSPATAKSRSSTPEPATFDDSDNHNNDPSADADADAEEEDRKYQVQQHIVSFSAAPPSSSVMNMNMSMNMSMNMNLGMMQGYPPHVFFSSPSPGGSHFHHHPTPPPSEMGSSSAHMMPHYTQPHASTMYSSLHLHPMSSQGPSFLPLPPLTNQLPPLHHGPSHGYYPVYPYGSPGTPYGYIPNRFPPPPSLEVSPESKVRSSDGSSVASGDHDQS